MTSIQPLSVAFRITDTVAKVVVVGELDVFSVARLKQVVQEARRSLVAGIVVDLAGVSFIDVRGLDLLVELARECRDQGVALSLRHPSEPVLRMQQLVGLDDTVLPIGA